MWFMTLLQVCSVMVGLHASTSLWWSKKQVALSAQGFSGFPGDKYPHLMLFIRANCPKSYGGGSGNGIAGPVELLKTEPVSAEELDRVKTQARADLLRIA
jgi:predicted Zn-dependent peptidase